VEVLLAYDDHVPTHAAQGLPASLVGLDIVILGVVLVTVVLDGDHSTAVGQVETTPSQLRDPHPHLRLGDRKTGVDDLHSHP